MSFGRAPTMPAHASGHPLAAKRDKCAEASRCPVPAVPRTKRAPGRANSAGALARGLYTRPTSADPITSISEGLTRSSENRRPRSDSPFTYARVNSINRENDAPENQRFEMGPAPKYATKSHLQEDYARSHALGRLNSKVESGMPWTDPDAFINSRPPVDPGRKNTLKNEMLAADQALEFAPTSATTGSKAPGKAAGGVAAGGYYPRSNALRREQKEALQNMEMAPTVQLSHPAGAESKHYHGRVSVIKREIAKQDNGCGLPDIPGYSAGDALPSFGRKSVLVGQCAPAGIAAH